MHAVAHEMTTEDQAAPFRLVMTVETAAIITLICISLLFRLIALGAAPMTALETKPALAAWRSVSAQASGEAIISDSPVLFWTQKISFSMLGASETTARFWTALAGVALSMSPLLFRNLLGRARAYLFAVLLTISPVLLTASRFSHGAVWAMLF